MNIWQEYSYFQQCWKHTIWFDVTYRNNIHPDFVLNRTSSRKACGQFDKGRNSIKIRHLSHPVPCCASICCFSMRALATLTSTYFFISSHGFALLPTSARFGAPSKRNEASLCLSASSILNLANTKTFFIFTGSHWDCFTLTWEPRMMTTSSFFGNVWLGHFTECDETDLACSSDSI